MKNVFKIYLIAAFLWFIFLPKPFSPLHAHPKTAESAIDNTAFIQQDYEIEQRAFDRKKLQNFAQKSEFLYDRPPPQPSWWSRILAWLMEQTGPPVVKGLGWMIDLLVALRYVFLIVFVLYIVSRILKMDISGLFFRRKKAEKGNIRATILDENIHELAFDDLIQQAIQQKDYRKAIRLYYLQALKQLSVKDLINWKINKTNNDYLHELSGTKLENDFWELTYLFDYVWYGEFPITEQRFKSVQQSFAKFARKVQ